MTASKVARIFEVPHTTLKDHLRQVQNCISISRWSQLASLLFIANFGDLALMFITSIIDATIYLCIFLSCIYFYSLVMYVGIMLRIH